jgi:hypothetical protein
MVGKRGKKAIPEEAMFDLGEASPNGTHALRNKGLFLDHDSSPFSWEANSENQRRP